MKKLRFLVYFVGFLGFLYVFTIAALYYFQEEIIFLPVKTPKQEKLTYKIPSNELFLVHPNGEEIHGLTFKSAKESKGLVLYFHGNAGNLKHWGRYSNEFTDRGYDVFMIDYRGYGKSDGAPSQVNLFEDGMLAYDWAERYYGSDSIIIYGRSLGSGVACHVSSVCSSKALILESPLSCVKDIVEFKYPFLYFPKEPIHNFSNISKIGGINTPIHIIHGTEDLVIPLESMEKMKELINEDDSFVTILGGGHNNLNSFPSFQSELDRLLK